MNIKKKIEFLEREASDPEAKSVIFELKKIDEGLEELKKKTYW